MKKILFKIIYPFWYLLSNTWVGNAIVLVIVLLLPFCFLCLFIPSGTNLNDGACWALAILSVIMSIMLISPLSSLHDYIEKTYKETNNEN